VEFHHNASAGAVSHNDRSVRCDTQSYKLVHVLVIHISQLSHTSKYYTYVITHARYAVATHTDFLVRGVVRRLRAFRGLKTSSDEIGRNVHAHFFRFFGQSFLPASQKMASEPRTKKSDALSDASSVSSDDVSDFLVREAQTTPRTKQSERVATTLRNKEICNKWACRGYVMLVMANAV